MDLWQIAFLQIMDQEGNNIPSIASKASSINLDSKDELYSVNNDVASHSHCWRWDRWRRMGMSVTQVQWSAHDSADWKTSEEGCGLQYEIEIILKNIFRQARNRYPMVWYDAMRHAESLKPSILSSTTEAGDTTVVCIRMLLSNLRDWQLVDRLRNAKHELQVVFISTLIAHGWWWWLLIDW